MIDRYTRTLETIAETEDVSVSDAAMTKLIGHLKSVGHMNMLPQLLREVRTIAARRRALSAMVEVAHEKDAPAALRAAAEAGIAVKKASINPTLIHGWRARKGDVLLDHSAKRALLSIYQKVIS
jgi:F0F1-type ATP synthase delta subunit